MEITQFKFWFCLMRYYMSLSKIFLKNIRIRIRIPQVVPA